MIYKYPKNLIEQAYMLRLGGLSNKAVSERMGINETTASRYYAYCLHRKELDAKYGDFADHIYNLDIPESIFDRLMKQKVSTVKKIKKLGESKIKKLDMIGDEAVSTIFSAVERYENNLQREVVDDTVVSTIDEVKTRYSKFDPTLTPPQRMVLKPRKVSYCKECETNYIEPDMARDIITLYVTCQLGYSAIRHVLGLDTDKKIEDVIRQHALGRTSKPKTFEYAGEEYTFYGELACPASKSISSLNIAIIQALIDEKYHTKNDPYVRDMLRTNTWYDDPVKAGGICCPTCKQKVKAYEKTCPNCGEVLHKYPTKLFNEFNTNKEEA